jgi:hypothetical protein
MNHLAVKGCETPFRYVIAYKSTKDLFPERLAHVLSPLRCAYDHTEAASIRQHQTQIRGNSSIFVPQRNLKNTLS